MKKILLVLALVSSVTLANAQQSVKDAGAAKSALEAAKAAADNAKKATKVATWLNLANKYMDAYNAPAGNGWVGASAQELQLIMKNAKAIAEEQVVVNGQQMTKTSYANADYYYGADGRLAVIDVTKPIVADALDQAVKAYQKAASVDAKGQKTADIIKGIETVGQKYTEEAYNAYTLGNLAKASQLFEKAAQAVAVAPCSKNDSENIYNAGFTAWAGGQYERAKSLFEKCVADKYYGDDGDVFAKLADAVDKLGDKDASKNILEQGFQAYPSSQAILIGLINYYTASGDNQDRLFSLIDEAKKNEPDNASLYYVEGNINKELGNFDKAIEAYNKAGEINPAYEYGYIGAGILYYNNAVDLQEKAQMELDDAKYMALVEQFETSLKNCIAPFEKAFEITPDAAVKVNVAEFLKNACYRFREADATYQAKYDKYSAFVAENQ